MSDSKDADVHARLERVTREAAELDIRRQAQIANQLAIINRIQRRNDRYREWCEKMGQAKDAEAYVEAEGDAESQAPATD